jgi:hypothetical protein
MKQYNLSGGSVGVTDGQGGEGVYDVFRWDGPRWHDIYTKFHKV